MSLSLRVRRILEQQLRSDLQSEMSGLDTRIAQILIGSNGNAAMVQGVLDDLEARLKARLAEQLPAAARDSAVALARASGLADVEIFGDRAARWAERHTFDLVRDLTDTSRDKLQRVVSAYFGADVAPTLDDLANAIAPLFGEDRAKRIAVTEATRASAQGERELVKELRQNYPASRVEEYWQTSRDEIVCPICSGLHNVRRESVGFVSDDGEVYDSPPAHPYCRCAIRTVVRAPEEALEDD